MAKLDTQDWRDKYDKMGARWDSIYKKRAPVLNNYEQMASKSLDSLLGESIPAVQELYRQSEGASKFATDEYLPAASKYLSDAKGYDTAERRQEASQKAMVDVQQGAEASRQAAMQRLESYGIDPSMTRGAALDQNVRLQTALEQVRQGREASESVETRGQQYLRDALGIGAQVQAGGLSAAQTAGNIGATATNAVNSTANTFTNIWGSPVTNLEAKRSLINDSLGAKVTEANFKQAQSDGSTFGNIMGSVGSIAGMAGGAYLGSMVGDPIGGAALGGQAGGSLGNAAGGQGASRQAAGV